LPAVLLAAVLVAFSGCGGGLESSRIQVKINGDRPASLLGFPVLATKNTTRVAGEDPVQDAAAVAAAVYPGGSQRPQAVALVDKDDWQGGIAAASLVSRPVGAPILMTDGGDVPGATSDAIGDLDPAGVLLAGRAQAFPVGKAATPKGLRAHSLMGTDPIQVAAAIDALHTKLAGKPSANVVVTSPEDPRFAMPAAAWAAKSGDSVLFATRAELPPATREAIAKHERPGIYVLGPKSLISDAVVNELRRLGGVTRVGADTPVKNAIAFARFTDGHFGWGIQDPGHGLVLANSNRPLDGPAAAALSASGTYGPLLLVDSADQLPAPLESFLLDIQPGYRSDPVRGVYNHAWLIGDESAISASVQSKIDQLTEIVRVGQGKAQ
jgi:hypothetical protein